jgi:hypothetical protein
MAYCNLADANPFLSSKSGVGSIRPSSTEAAIPPNRFYLIAKKDFIARCTKVLLQPPYAGAKYTASFSDNSKSRISTQLFWRRSAHRGHFREAGLSAPHKARVCIEEFGCTVMHLRSPYAGLKPGAVSSMLLIIWDTGISGTRAYMPRSPIH